jgi:diaminopimelate epimerase
MPIHFIKFHGLGNDYLVFEAGDLSGIEDLSEFARKISHRHYGAGADGIAVIGASEDQSADFHVRIFNPDGSEAGLSGNGTRCAAAYLFYKKLWTAPELRFNTRSGVKRYLLQENPVRGKFVFDSELGHPKFDSCSIPMLTEEPLKRVIGYPLIVEGETFSVTALQVGNPNCCIFVNDFNDLDWRRIGRAIENHQQFPDRTNVVFIRPLDREKIELRIWERGVGETSASGTCSCAAAVASMVNGKTGRHVNVLTPGGEASIKWREDDEVVLTGSAEVVYSGQWLTQGN